jgi:hypothetical protein
MRCRPGRLTRILLAGRASNARKRQVAHDAGSAFASSILDVAQDCVDGQASVVLELVGQLTYYRNSLSGAAARKRACIAESAFHADNH